MPLLRGKKKARKGKYFEEMSRFVQGSYSQNDRRFSDFSRGRQCVPNSVLSVVYEQVKSVSEWKRADMDIILNAGDEWYNEIRLKQDISNDFLLIEDVPRTHSAFGKSFKLFFSDSYAGLISGTEAGVGEMVIDLSCAIDCVMVRGQNSILTIGNNAMALLFKDGQYYSFDPHSRTAKGLIAVNGKSIRVRYNQVGGLQSYLLNLANTLGGGVNIPYELTPIEVIINDSGDTDDYFPSISQAEIMCTNLAPDVEIISEEEKKFVFYPITYKQANDICDKFSLAYNENASPKSYEISNNGPHYPPLFIRAVKADGNCFFRALDTLITGSDNNNHLKIRRLIVNHLNSNPTAFNFALRDDNATLAMQINNSKMSIAGTWATELEIFGAANLFRINIHTYYRQRWLQYSPRPNATENDDKYPNIYLRNQNNHFEVVTKVENDVSFPSSTNKYRGTKRKYDFDRYYDRTSQRKIKQSKRKSYQSSPIIRKAKKHKMNILYTEDDFKTRSKYRTKQKYWNDLNYSNLKRIASTTKYNANDTFKASIIRRGKRNYRKCKDYKQNMIDYNKYKYHNNEKFKQEIINKVLVKYHSDNQYNAKLKEISKSTYKMRKKMISATDRVVDDFRIFTKSNCPEYICVICIRLFFSNQVAAVNKSDKLNTLFNELVNLSYYHKCSTKCKDNCDFKNILDNKWWICYNCKRKIGKKQYPHEAFKNNLDPGPIPHELGDLNSLERHLIALHVPFVKMVSLPKGGQYGVHGPVISVPSNVQSTAEILPRAQANDQLIQVKLKRKLRYKGYYKFEFVDKRKIIRALKLLKDINPHYNHIKVDQDWENSLPQNSQPNNEEEDEANEEEVIGNVHDTCLQPIDIGQHVLDFEFNKILSVAPAEGNSPVSILNEPDNEAKAFPTIYPDGSNSFDSDRNHLTASRYFHCRLMSADNRWSKSSEYIFFAQFISELIQVKSSASIALRKGRSFDKKTIKAVDLINGEHLQRALLRDDAYKFLSPLRGTPQFWYNTQKDLFAMLRQLGVPTWFCSFSSADFRWKEFMQGVLNIHQDSRNVEDLTWTDKAELIRNNPVTVARMFQQRFHRFLNNVLKSDAAPIGKVRAFFYRVEFQMRGSPHVHAVFWIDGAPKYGVDSDQNVIDFVDHYLTCKLPHPDDPLHEVVKSVQKHSKSHSKSCRKKGTVCRFNFPRPPLF